MDLPVPFSPNSPNPMPNAWYAQDDISQDMNRIASFERSFCSSFFCCDAQLSGFHELLEHIEEAHVIVRNLDGRALYHPKVGPFSDKPTTDHSRSKPQPHAHFEFTFPFPPTPLTRYSSPDERRAAVAFHEYDGLDYYDHDYTQREPSDHVESLPPSTTPSPAPTIPSSIPLSSPSSASSDSSSDEEPMSPSPSPVSPTPIRPIPIMSMTEMSTDASRRRNAITTSHSHKNKVRLEHHGPKMNKRWKNIANRERKYKCPTPGCIKSYLNANGLKYHLEKGKCDIDSEVTSSSDFERVPATPSPPSDLTHAHDISLPSSPASTSPPTP
ncbi:hypothetical protein VNI00_016324 [Paramarasmius palmivorus]|uniref:C2H2-type domain-containing protein n=1 Tax=Paramarasmius palmivorus TaxID=297713 RepID=A0AAW0BF86_9AGAR